MLTLLKQLCYLLTFLLPGQVIRWYIHDDEIQKIETFRRVNVLILSLLRCLLEQLFDVKLEIFFINLLLRLIQIIFEVGHVP